MQLISQAGGGKTRIIKYLKKKLNTDLHATATTGKAATHVPTASTIHSLVGLPCKPYEEKPLTGEKLTKLQRKFSNITNPSGMYIVIDEVSMLGFGALYWLNERLKQIFSSSKEFGGASIILVGDYGQLGAVADTSMYKVFTNKARNQKELIAHMLFKSFTTVVKLKKNFRAKDADEDFQLFLEHMRDG